MTITADVREYISRLPADYYFTKREVAENLWPEWKDDALAACNDWRCFRSYVGNLILLEKEAGNILEADTPGTWTGAKYYKRVVKATPSLKVSGSLTHVPTSELVAELNRRFG